MQTLTLDQLPTPVLLVWGGTWSEMAQLSDSPEKIVSYLKSGDSEWIDINGNWQLIGNLSELTEEQASELVDSDNEYGVRMFRNYRTTSMPYFDEQIDSLQSLHSAIEAKGYYLQNPMGKRYDPSACVKKPEYRQEQSFNEYEEELRKAYSKALSDWNEAQSKTLPANTLIFKRV